MAVGIAAPTSTVASTMSAVEAAADPALPAMQIYGRDSGPDFERHDPGLPSMTPTVLRDCCIKNGGYESPDLNQVLLLPYKGFRTIENLTPYSNVKSLFLECNGITRIENLEALHGLVSLYLQSNCISRLENLDHLTSLQYLNLSQNSISIVENLENLRSLETLKLACNKIVNVEDLSGLAARPTLKSVDVSQNYFEDGDALLEFWPSSLPDVECLYLHHNPCSRGIKDYRRRAISGLSRLRWLDERPVTAIERTGCEAWASGGKDAELKAKQEMWWSEKHANDRSFNTFRQTQEAVAEQWKAHKEQSEERARQREKAESELRESGALTESSFAQGWRPRATMELPAERKFETKASSREAEIRMKVQNFLEGRRRKADDVVAKATAPSGELQETTPEEIARPLPMSSTGIANGFETESETQEPRILSVVAPVDAVKHMKEATVFTWNGFRDRRLGRLAAEMRLNFKKVAPALSDEFGVMVDAEACRQRYRELSRPNSGAGASSQTGEVARREIVLANTGKAKDAPAPDADTVQDFSQWWIRKITSGRNDSNGGTMSAAAVSVATVPEANALEGKEKSDECIPVQGCTMAPSFSPPERRQLVSSEQTTTFQDAAVASSVLAKTGLSAALDAPADTVSQTITAIAQPVVSVAPASTVSRKGIADLFELD